MWRPSEMRGLPSLLKPCTNEGEVSVYLYFVFVVVLVVRMLSMIDYYCLSCVCHLARGAFLHPQCRISSIDCFVCTFYTTHKLWRAKTTVCIFVVDHRCKLVSSSSDTYFLLKWKHSNVRHVVTRRLPNDLVPGLLQSALGN